MFEGAVLLNREPHVKEENEKQQQQQNSRKRTKLSLGKMLANSSFVYWLVYFIDFSPFPKQSIR